ncbi:predicted protein [Naegleria gruberi]|uniref:Protein-L-isoaspartate O-methyltransferase n=1 Tax=Naegleria gruberi TaxID=5762 RepID=D2VAT0_NAEGR|nr:uncharacterized protein NAEGRDRAFT_32547 [Naegleria gruberi]EFC46004.1 predicted protein [Naegleria gruberi]|eukprot:XP_002678748.1 predicted protein [Naegleria gruberi strain NEG-M]
MAWRCSGQSNAELIANLFKSNIISSNSVSRAMSRTDRALFCRSDHRDYAYLDQPLPIGNDVTISAPHMHAYCLELLEDHLKPGNRAMDVGSGSGYLVATMAEMMAPQVEHVVEGTKIVGIEYLQSIYLFGKENIEKYQKTKDLMNQGIIEMIKGDGWKGYAQGGPYHAIHVGAAASTLPHALVEQLANGGRLIIPVGDIDQHLMVIDKDINGKVTQKKVMGVRYVPLVNPTNCK